MNILFKITIIYIIISLFTGNIVFGQENKEILQTKLTFEKNEYEVKDLLDYIITNYNINIVYDNANKELKGKISIPKTTITLKQVLEILCNDLPFQYVVKRDYIILQPRKLSAFYEIKGIVTDSLNRPLEAASLFIQGKAKGSITKANGEYLLKLPPGEYRLYCMYMGYETQNIMLNLYNNRINNFTLIEEKNAIPEVKITSQKKLYGNLKIGRTIETIEAKQIEELNVNNPSDILHARVNGVWATQTSGAPGDHQKIRIRGINSLFGSVEPLYIVDGVLVPTVNLRSLGITDLNVHDIESVTVLKDASSTALYGYMGGNGVVIIDTKKGGEKKINFSTKQGFQWFNNFYNLMDTKNFLKTFYTSDKLFYTEFYIRRPNVSPKYPSYSWFLDDINWQDVIFQPGNIKEYQLSGQGNIKTFDYYISGNYFEHTGIVVNSSYKKYSLSTNISKVFNSKLSAQINYKTCHQNNNNNLDSYLGNSLIYRGINAEPEYTSAEEYINMNNRFYLLNQNIYEPNPYALITSAQLKNKYSPQYVIDNYERIQKINFHSVNFMAKYRFLNDFYFNASSSISFRDYTFKTDVDENYLLSNEGYIILSQQYNLAYSRQIKEHEFKLTSGVKLYKDNINWKVDSAYGDFLEGENEYEPIEEIYLKGSMSRYGEKGSIRRSINSIIGHLSYNYNKKFFISLVANYDHLIEGRNVEVTDLFPSVAINWDISREYWFRQIKSLEYFNIYANWGHSGNYALNSLSNDLYNKNIYPYSNDSEDQGYYIKNLSNHNLSHEKITEFDIGTELSLFQNRAKININYFFKTNSDLLLQRDIPYYYGGGTQFVNIGIMKNNGREYSVDLIPVKTSNFNWHIKLGYSKNNQYIKQLADTNILKFNKLDLLYPDFIIKEGGQVGSIYGYKIIGRITKEDNLGLDRVGEALYQIKYLNPDSSNLKINEDDKVIIGNSIPDFTWNFYNTFSYKNFELYFLIHAVIGVDKYNATKAATYITGTNWDVNTIIINNKDRYNASSLYYESDAFIEDASFIRFKMLTLSYSPKKVFFNHVSAKFSVSIENLVTITKYSGYDPEATIFTDNNFSDNAIDRGAYPIPKSMYFSIGFTFK